MYLPIPSKETLQVKLVGACFKRKSLTCYILYSCHKSNRRVHNITNKFHIFKIFNKN